MSAVEIELTRARRSEAELGHAADRLIVVADAVARAESSAQIGAEALGVSRSIGAVTDDVRQLGRLLGLVADRVENADALPAGFYDRWINQLLSTIASSATTPHGVPSSRFAASRRPAGVDVGSQPSLDGFGDVGGVVFVANPLITLSATTSTSSPFGPMASSVNGQGRTEDLGLAAEIGRSVPIDSGTMHGRNAAACDLDPLACHGEVTSDELFAVLGFVPALGEVIDAAFCLDGDDISCAAVVVPLAGGKAVRLTADSFAAVSRATDGFRVTDKAWKHITDAHVAGGRRVTSRKSVWASDADIVTHIGNARTLAPSHFSRGNTVIIADAGNAGRVRCGDQTPDIGLHRRHPVERRGRDGTLGCRERSAIGDSVSDLWVVNAVASLESPILVGDFDFFIRDVSDHPEAKILQY